MTDPVIPRAAVVATTEARYAHRDASGPHGAVKCRCGQSFRTGLEQLQHASHAILTAAIPHLRPPVEAQELRLATQVALKLGRQEAAEELGAYARSAYEGMAEPETAYWQGFVAAARHMADKARDTGKGNSA